MRFAENQQGFTLVELMAAVLITVVIVTATMTTVVTSNRANVVNTQVADTQQNVRLAIDLLSRDIKLAGYNYNATDPGTAAVGTCNATIGAIVKPVGLLPQDQTPAGADAGPDGVSMVLPVMNITGWTLTAAVGGTQNAPTQDSAISLSGAAITEMTAQGLALGSTISIGGALAKTVKTLGATSIGFGTGNYVDGKFPAGTPVYLMQCVQYQVVANTPAICGTNTPCLVRNNVPLVDGVEDMQITYACDGCNQAAPIPYSRMGSWMIKMAHHRRDCRHSHREILFPTAPGRLRLGRRTKLKWLRSALLSGQRKRRKGLTRREPRQSTRQGP